MDVEELEKYRKCCEMVIPTKIELEENTGILTVKFYDKSEMKVHINQLDDKSLEFALGYCVLRQVLTEEEIEELIKNKEVK